VDYVLSEYAIRYEAIDCNITQRALGLRYDSRRAGREAGQTLHTRKPSLTSRMLSPKLLVCLIQPINI